MWDTQHNNGLLMMAGPGVGAVPFESQLTADAAHVVPGAAGPPNSNTCICSRSWMLGHPASCATTATSGR